MGFSSDQPMVSNQLVTNFQLPSAKETDLFDERLEKLLEKICDVTNTKEGAVYFLNEIATFQKYYVSGDPQSSRNVYRKVIDFGALPNTATKSVAHGVTFSANTRLTRLYGAATDPTAISFLPLPFASPTLADNISLSADGTNVIVTTGSNRASYTSVSIVLEYTK